MMKSSFHILLVEDNTSDIRLIREALRDVAVPTHLSVVEDGIQALAFLRHEPPYAAAPQPDLLLLDLNLPQKPGHEVVAELRADPALRRVPVVVLTTSEAQSSVRLLYDLGVNCYVLKPVELEAFLATVRAIVEFWGTYVCLPSRGAPDQEWA